MKHNSVIKVMHNIKFGYIFIYRFVSFSGTVLVFRVYSIVCAVFFVLFILVNFANRSEGGFSADLPDDVDPKTV